MTDRTCGFITVLWSHQPMYNHTLRSYPNNWAWNMHLYVVTARFTKDVDALSADDRANLHADVLDVFSSIRIER